MFVPECFMRVNRGAKEALRKLPLTYVFVHTTERCVAEIRKALPQHKLIVEDDPLVKQNDHILDALFISLGVYAADKVAADNTLTHEANVSDNAHVSEVSATILITLVHEQTQTWNDPDLTALVTNTARKWLTPVANEQLSPEEQTLRHRLLTALFPEEMRTK